jgi:hypothetical protein
MPAELRIVIRAAALAVLTASARADGDVVGWVDAWGDLWLYGDDLDTGIRVEAGGDDSDTFRVSGLDATTINGLPEVTFVAPGLQIVLVLGEGDNRAWMGTDDGGAPSCCNRELTVVTGAGADELVLIGPFGWTVVELGGGNDTVTVQEGAGDLIGSVILGEGDDVVTAGGYDLGPTVDMGPGNDLLQIGGSVHGTVDLGPGDDHVRMHGSHASVSRVEFRGDLGNDVFDFDELQGGWLTVDAGAGDDQVFLVGDRNDPFTHAIDPTTLFLGPGNDRLIVSDALLGHALFDGGADVDAFLTSGRNEYAFPPDVRGFEPPGRARGAPVAVSTTIAGRIVDADGEPVAGASVFLPQLGRLALTGPEGDFSFGGVIDDRGELELVAGARLDGSSATVARRVELLAYRTSDTGALVLDARQRNTLVFGPQATRLRALEQNLSTLGYRSEEVSRVATLPPSLVPYDVVWHTGGELPFAQRQRLAAFVRAGGGLHLSGSTVAVNSTLQTVVTALVRAGGVTVGAGGTAAVPRVFNANAVGGVARTPNVLTDFYRFAPGRYIAGAAPRNVLAWFPSTGSVQAAAWEPFDLDGGRGHLTLVMTDEWIQPAESLDVLENLQRFLARERHAVPR